MDFCLYIGEASACLGLPDISDAVDVIQIILWIIYVAQLMSLSRRGPPGGRPPSRTRSKD